jgi:hypothetical protein
MLVSIAISAKFQHGDIGLRLAEVVQMNRILNANSGSLTDPHNQKRVQRIHTRGVLTSYRTHLDDLPFDQLDAIIFSQYPGFYHAPVLSDVEMSARSFGRHGSFLDLKFAVVILLAPVESGE